MRILPRLLPRLAVVASCLLAAASAAEGPLSPPASPARLEAVRRSVAAAAQNASTVLLDAKGDARGDYDVTTGRWTRYETAWHTGQVVAGLLGAYDVLGDAKLLSRAVDGADAFVGLRLEEPAALRGMLRTWHDEENPNLTMTTLTDGAAPVFDVARRTGEEKYLRVLREAGDWMASRLWIPSRGMFYDVVLPDGRVMGKDVPVDPSLDKDDARYGTEGAFFAHLYRATGEKRYLELFLEPCRRMVADQRDGLWLHLRPNEARTGTLHGRFNIWYAEALLEAYDLTREKPFLDAALATARAYSRLPDADGTMYYRHRLDGWKDARSPSGSVVAFAGILWLRLARLGYPEFEAPVERAVDWLLANQYPADHPDPNLRGAYYEAWVKVKDSDWRVFQRDIATAFGLRFLAGYIEGHGAVAKRPSRTGARSAVAGPYRESAPGRDLRPDNRFFHLPEGRSFGPAAAVGIGPKGQIYVLHRGEGMLTEFDSAGRFVRDLGTGSLKKPHGLHVDAEGHLWVTDVDTHVVLKLDPEGRVLMVLGVLGSRGEWHEEFDVLAFDRPTDVSTGPAGEIYVADGYGNSRIVKLAPDGRFLKAWGRRGTAPGEFHSPHNVEVGRDGLVYVADRDNLRVQVFDAEGSFRTMWTHVGKPNGLEATERGLLVTDSAGERLLEVAADGRVLWTYGGPGKAAGQFTVAHGVATDRDGALYVAEIASWRVQRLVPPK